MNGAVWFRVEGSPMDHVIIRNAILNAEMMGDIEAEVMVEKLIELANKARRKNKN